MIQGNLKLAERFLLILFLAAVLSACATGYDKKGVYHKVRGGENIWKIARYYHVPVQDLAEWNNIQDAKDIEEGLRLYIPKIKKEKRLKYKKLPKSELAKFDAPIQLDQSRFGWPLPGPVLSPFGIRNGRRHDGIDIKAKSGTPIRAAAKGKIVFNERLKGYGKMIIVKHKDRFFSIYAHNSRNTVKKGQRVAKGQVIGYVGQTGRATGPHLHFEVRQGDKARNPFFFLPEKGAPKVRMITKREKREAVKEVPETPEVEEEIEPEVNDSRFSRRREMMEKLRTKKRH